MMVCLQSKWDRLELSINVTLEEGCGKSRVGPQKGHCVSEDSRWCWMRNSLRWDEVSGDEKTDPGAMGYVTYRQGSAWEEDEFSFSLLLSSVCLFVCLVFWLHHAACRVLFPWPGMEPAPLHWERQVLATGPQGSPRRPTVKQCNPITSKKFCKDYF